MMQAEKPQAAPFMTVIKPLARELIIADSVHGESGLDGPELPEPGFAPQSKNAIQVMAENKEMRLCEVMQSGQQNLVNSCQ